MIRSLSARLESTPLAVRETRRFVRDILRVWDAEILGETAELLAGELVTNAVLYAGTPIDVHLAWSDGNAPRLRVNVCDEADTMPQVHCAGGGCTRSYSPDEGWRCGSMGS